MPALSNNERTRRSVVGWDDESYPALADAGGIIATAKRAAQATWQTVTPTMVSVYTNTQQELQGPMKQSESH
jgi:hypothetical protein